MSARNDPGEDDQCLRSSAAEFLTRAAAAVAATTAILAGTGQGETGAAATGGDPPEPIRGNQGARILDPTNQARQAQGPNRLRPPATDSGTLPTLRWSFADSHIKMREGGWSRQTTIREIPSSTDLALVNMQLKAGGVRELHLAQAGRSGLSCSKAGRGSPRRRRRSRLPGRRRRGGLVELPVWHSALDPGPGRRRLRVRARIRRRELQRGQYIRGHGLARPYPPRGLGQELRRARAGLRRHPRKGALHLPVEDTRTPCRGPDRWRRQIAHAFQLPTAGPGASPHDGRLFTSRTRPRFPLRPRSRPHTSKWSPAACASCTGTRTRTRPSTTSPARHG